MAVGTLEGLRLNVTSSDNRTQYNTRLILKLPTRYVVLSHVKQSAISAGIMEAMAKSFENESPSQPPSEAIQRQLCAHQAIH